MRVTRISPFSGQENTLDLDITDEQLMRWIEGELIQDVFPHLTPGEREFLLTGITEEEWDIMFDEDENEDEDDEYN